MQGDGGRILGSIEHFLLSKDQVKTEVAVKSEFIYYFVFFYFLLILRINNSVFNGLFHES